MRARTETGPGWEVPRALVSRPGCPPRSGGLSQVDMSHVPNIFSPSNTTTFPKAETFPRALQSWYLLWEMQPRKKLLNNPLFQLQTPYDLATSETTSDSNCKFPTTQRLPFFFLGILPPAKSQTHTPPKPRNKVKEPNATFEPVRCGKHLFS